MLHWLQHLMQHMAVARMCPCRVPTLQHATAHYHAACQGRKHMMHPSQQQLHARSLALKPWERSSFISRVFFVEGFSGGSQHLLSCYCTLPSGPHLQMKIEGRVLKDAVELRYSQHSLHVHFDDTVAVPLPIIAPRS